MNAHDLRHALAQDSADFTPDLVARAVEALAGPPGADGLPDLAFLGPDRQVAVLAALYRDFIDQVLARPRRSVS